MKFKFLVVVLFLIYEISFYLVKGQTIEEKNDCTKYYNFIYKNHRDYSIEECCSSSEINCENGYIKSMILYGEDNMNLNELPNFPKIEQLNIYNYYLKEIPNSILNLTTLKHLDISNNGIRLIPPSIKNLSNLENLNLSRNQIKIIPSDIKHLSKLKELNLSQNYINEVPNELFNLTILKTLDLNTNKIVDIPPSIGNLKDLEKLYLFNNNIEKLPNEIFSLKNLKEFEFQDNKDLKTKMIKFSDFKIQNCNFNNVNIECYEPDTCKSVIYKNNEYTDEKFQKEYKICTEEEIEEILSSINITRESYKLSFLLIILGSVIILFIGFLITFMLIKKKISYKRNEEDLDSSKVFRSGSIRVLLKINNRSNSNDINNNNNINDSINDNISNNNNNEKHLNLNSRNSVESINNNNQNNNYSFDIQVPPPSYDDENYTMNNNNNNNNNGTDIYNISINKGSWSMGGTASVVKKKKKKKINIGNNSLPEYTLINQLMGD